MSICSDDRQDEATMKLTIVLLHHNNTVGNIQENNKHLE